MPTIIHKELSYRVRGVLLDGHNSLGPMLPERFHQDAVALGLEEQGIRCQTEKAFEVHYRDVRLPNYLRERRAAPEWEDRPHVGDLLYPDLTSGLFRVLHRVHQELGPGFLHQVYRRAVMVELTSQQINYEYIKEIPVYYRDHHLGIQPARLILVDGKVLLATVAVRDLEEAMQAQLKARLRHMRLPLGLLANSAGTALQIVAIRT